MISNATQRAYDIVIAIKVYGWHEHTFNLLRGLEYKEKAEYPVVTGTKVMLVGADFKGPAEMWWHEFDTEREQNVPHYSRDRGLATQLMERTAKKWGWSWLVDIDESRTAIRVRVTPESDPLTLIGPFAMVVCMLTIQALGIEVPQQ